MNTKQTKLSTSWLPIRFKQAGAHIFVHLVDAKKLDLSMGFFPAILNLSLKIA